MTPEQYVQLEAPTDEQTQALWDLLRSRHSWDEAARVFHFTLDAQVSRIMADTDDPTDEEIANAGRILRAARDRVWSVHR